MNDILKDRNGVTDFYLSPGKLALPVGSEVTDDSLSLRPNVSLRTGILFETRGNLVYFSLDEIKILAANVCRTQTLEHVGPERGALENHVEVLVVQSFGFGLPRIERVVKVFQRNLQLVAVLPEVMRVEFALEVLFPELRVPFPDEFLFEFLNDDFVDEFHVFLKALL